MIAFRDRRRQTWTRRIDVAAAVRMRDLAGVDVMAATADPEAASRLRSPEGVTDIVDALYALFLPDAQRLGVTDQQFGKRLRGVKADELQSLFFDGVDAFFAQPGPPGKGGDRRVTAADLWHDVYRLAGEACIAPGPHTYGELAAMSDGRRKLEWSQTACLRADVRNAAFGRKGPASEPVDLDPTGGLKDAGASSGGMELKPDDFWILGSLFVGKG